MVTDGVMELNFLLYEEELDCFDDEASMYRAGTMKIRQTIVVLYIVQYFFR